MYTKKQVIFYSVITFIITFELCFFGGAYFYLRQGKDKLVSAREVIAEHYVDKLSDDDIKEIEDFAISSMVDYLDDPYSYYFNERRYAIFEEDMKEEYVGIGITVEYDEEKNEMVVIAPSEDSPAEKAGVLAGDIITKVDDIVVTPETYEEVVDYIGGDDAKDGDSLTLYVKRGDTEKSITVVREVLSVDTVTFKMLDENIGYLRISQFKMNTVEDFKDSLSELKKNNAKGFIIDLRGNPGGYADSVIEMTDMLLPEGVIAYLEDNKGERKYYNSDKNELKIPMAVLINENSASASELMAGSLQAHDKAIIVGKKSFGKAVGQTPYRLTDGSAIYLTSARYFTPLGKCIDKKGIVPDIEVDLPEELKDIISDVDTAKDTQLKTAIEAVYDKIEKQ